eukprot:jgi/Mesvir1/11687/Mv00079-RA.1
MHATMQNPEHRVNSLSEKLLQGWTMLAECCPREDCRMPLVRSRDKKVRYCVNCEEEVFRGDNLFVVDLDASRPGGSQQLDAVNGHGLAGEASMRRGGASKKYGDEEGGSDDEGGGLPMEEPPTAQQLADAMARDMAQYGTGEAAPRDDGQLAREAPGATVPLGAVARDVPMAVADAGGNDTADAERKAWEARLAEKRKRSDAVSAGIAEKLLQGWCLLNECCPMEACLAPLVRNKSGKRFCVGCSLWVKSENESRSEAPPDRLQAQPNVVQPQPQPQPGQGPTPEPAGLKPVTDAMRPSSAQTPTRPVVGLMPPPERGAHVAAASPGEWLLPPDAAHRPVNWANPPPGGSTQQQGQVTRQFPGEAAAVTPERNWLPQPSRLPQTPPLLGTSAIWQTNVAPQGGTGTVAPPSASSIGQEAGTRRDAGPGRGLFEEASQGAGSVLPRDPEQVLASCRAAVLRKMEMCHVMLDRSTDATESAQVAAMVEHA